MAVAWSKTVPYNCYELGHCWTPSCSEAFYVLAWHAFKYSIKVYGTLYLSYPILYLILFLLFGVLILLGFEIPSIRKQLAAILRRRKKDYFLKRLVPETVRSAFFLATNGSLFIASFCFWRKIFPFYVFYNTFLVGLPITAFAYHIERSDRGIQGESSYLTAGFLPAACASFIAIVLERKARRGILALYLLNLATETAFNSAASQGVIPRIKHGEVLLFSISIAIYTYLYKRNVLTDNIKRMLVFFLGKGELPGSVDTADETSPTATRPTKSSHQSGGFVSYLPKEIKSLIALWRGGPKHSLCRHRFNCLASSVESGVKLFVGGYLVQATLKLFRALTNVIRNPRGLLDALKHRDNFNLGLFLGSFTALLRICHCVLRWVRNEDNPLHGLVSGFVAGWSMLWYKSSSVAMWVTSKLAEILYFKGIDSGLLPFIKHGDVLVYTLSTAFVLHAAVFEPHNIRPAYWRFLLGLTDQKFSLMNRKLLDVYGTNASKLYPNYWPDFDPKFTPNL